MKTTGTFGRILFVLSVLSLVLSLTLGLSSCSSSEPPAAKEEIAALMAKETDLDRDFVTSYLHAWGITGYYDSKMRGIEVVYRDYYVTDIPDPYTLAVGTVELFLEHFYDEIDLTSKNELTDALIVCYVETIGDPYSVYRTATEFEDYDTDMSGSFVGIGVSVIYNRIEETITVTEVHSGSGAEDAGILANDVIIKVGGESTTELGYNTTVHSIRGEEGTYVDITVLRGDEELTFSIQRRKIVEESVKYSIDENKIGYIKISSFKANTAEQFRKAIDFMEDNEAVGIIYDLRSNPGGYLSSVISMLSYIAPKGTVLASFSNDYSDDLKATDSHSVTLPTVVLCNSNTASAGELFTAALRDFGEMGLLEVTTVGANTYGKGVLQTSFSFTDGSAITLTVAYYNPPSGVNYDGIGIIPDVEVEESEEGDAQLDAAMAEILKLIK